MKGYIKMEKSGGYLNNAKKIQRTKILPLRWIGNLCEKPAKYHLNMSLHHMDHDDYGLSCRYHAYASTLLYKPYFWWGTYYELNMEE
jgi:hypothetical protein